MDEMNSEKILLPYIELFIVLLLVMITIYRKRLSSNYEYRRLTSKANRKFTFFSILIVITKKIAKFVSDYTGILLVHGGKMCQVKFLDEFVSFNDSNIITTLNNQIVIHTIKQFDLNLSDDNSTKTNIIDFLSLLSRDNILHLLTYLPHKDIGALAQVNVRLYNEVTSDFIWEQLWLFHYKALWTHPRITNIRHLRGIYWDPTLNFGAPQQGWYAFYRQFTVSYLDWLLAGANTQEFCFISLYGKILDITTFLSRHPGSPESLMEAAGGDGTSHFIDIGHSKHALLLSTEFEVVQNSAISHNSVKKMVYEDFFTMEGKRAVSIAESKTISPSGSSAKRIVSSAVYLSNKLTSSMAIRLNLDDSYDKSPTVIDVIKMIPSIRGFHNCFNLSNDESRHGAVEGEVNHLGVARPIWDPLEQRWYVWWTCCGCGVGVDLEDSVIRH